MFNIFRKLILNLPAERSKTTFKARNTSISILIPPIIRSSILSMPEPTHSLLFIINEDTSKIEYPALYNLAITFTNGETNMKRDFGGSLHQEPSLIWTRLPIEKNEELEEKTMYWPAYSRLYPQNRYQYLNWLTDITQKTNLSYVFLYYYGLERHLLVGDFEAAVNEIKRLIKFHNEPTFVWHATKALLVACVYRNRLDIIE